MREVNKEIVFLVLFILTISFTSAKYYNNYSDVILVCNANSPASQEICNYFLQERASKGFLFGNIINLTGIVTDETINYSQYFSILNQTNLSIKSSENSGKIINYIITTKGVPLRTGYGYNCDLTPMPSECRSVDSRLMKDLGANTSYHSREYNYVKDTFNHTLYGGYLITRLDGYSTEDVKQLIDSSTITQANGLSGEILLNCYVSNSQYYIYNTECLLANTTINSKGYQSNFNNTTFIKNIHNLGGYVSWGSNSESIGCTSASCANSSSWNLSFSPGALGETFVSTSARTLSAYPWVYGQSLISDLIKYNITGIKGYVYEPTTSALTNVNTLWERYLSGYNLADSYYMASSYRNWTDIIIGDPKTYVISQSINNPTILESPLNGERIQNETIINFTINSNDFWEIDSVWYSINQGETNITLEYPHDILIDTFGNYGEYNLTIYINDTAGTEDSKKYFFIFNTTIGITPSYSKFNGSQTTNIKALENKEQVDNLVLEISDLGKIEFLETLNLSGIDLNSNIDMYNNFVYLNSENIPELNVSANITLYNIPQDLINPKIFKDDEICLDCYNFTPLDSVNVTFNVSGFSKYTIQSLDGENLTTCQTITEPGRYFLINDVNSTSTCFNITANNVFIEGQNFRITQYIGYGIYSRNNYTVIKNITITKTANENNLDYGVYLITNKLNKLQNILINNSYQGILLLLSEQNEITNLNLSNNRHSGAYFHSSISNSIRETTFTRNLYGVYFDLSSMYNNLSNSTTIHNSNAGIYLANGASYNSFSNISAENNSNKDFYFYSADNNKITDNPNVMYYIRDNRKSRIIIENSSAGKIEFLEGIYTDKYYYTYSNMGRNLSRDFIITNNFIYANSTGNPYLDVSANITLYNVSTDISNPKIFRGNQICTTCFNYTPLDAGTIKFFVNGFSNYSIQTYLESGEILVGIASPTQSNYTNKNQTLIITTISNETIDKIWYKWNGTNITYDSTTQIIFEEGENTITAWANDTTGNINTTSISFNVDTIAPNIEIISPLNNTNYTTTTITLNITHSSDATRIWWINESQEITYTQPVTITFSENRHNITACTTDNFGNENCTTTTFTITQAQDINQETPENTGNAGSSGGGGGGGGSTTQLQNQTNKINPQTNAIINGTNTKLNTTTQNIISKTDEIIKSNEKNIIKISIALLITFILVSIIIFVVKKISRY